MRFSPYAFEIGKNDAEWTNQARSCIQILRADWFVRYAHFFHFKKIRIAQMPLYTTDNTCLFVLLTVDDFHVRLFLHVQEPLWRVNF